MKPFKIIFLSLAFLAASMAFSSCGNNAGSADEQGSEYTSAYICPMHCKDSGSDEPGDCPVCGMAYKENKDHTEDDGHTH